jgi:hypothetical protein
MEAACTAIRKFWPAHKTMRSISRADKLRVECGVGMSVATDLAARNPEGPLGPEAHTDLLRLSEK